MGREDVAEGDTMSTKWWAIVLAILGLATLSAQESRHWIAADFGPQVHVFDFTGVCIYVLDVPYTNRGGGIAVLPKTQLPKGAGCQ